jgi:hypothetical protein
VGIRSRMRLVCLSCRAPAAGSRSAARANVELGSFTPLDLELEDPDELLLTEQVELLLTNSDRLDPPPGDVLVLDDILAELGPGSRVVRLFDPASTPSPGQLNARIEQHLRDGTSQAAPLDASQALHEALAELRRSLR